MRVSLRRRSPRAQGAPGSAGVTVLGLACAAGLASLGCGSAQETSAAPTGPVAEVVAAPEPTGIENFRRWSDRIAAGGQPLGEAAFQSLAAMGYRTVLSVDGAKPDVENATKHGLRYVHVPFGYDGVPKDAQVKIVKVVRTSDGPVFIHCHHGVARGPAGAMIARIAVDGISNEEASRELKESGCDPRYKGLFRDVADAVPPTAEELSQAPSELPSFVSSGSLADQMAVLDRTWARVGWAKNASWSAPKEHPDVDPPHEARLLWEGFRELARLGDVESHGPDFLAELSRAEESGHSLEEALLKGDRESATKQFAVIKKSCDSCHARWRD
jgi:protein tyrosine phosphatase (PTP) superfamily phosphohydrolase (DUF442 family)